MQKALGLVTIIGEHQSKAIKNRITFQYIFFLLFAIIDESNELNKNLSVISSELVLSFLFCMSSDIETNSFTCFKLPILNLKLK